jgi:hypothetical protein
MYTFDDKILHTKSNFRGFIVVTGIKKIETRENAYPQAYLNAKIMSGYTYKDKETGKERPGYYWIPVSIYDELAVKILNNVKDEDILYIEGKTAAFIDNNKKQSGVKINLSKYIKIDELPIDFNKIIGIKNDTLINDHELYNIFKEVSKLEDCHFQKKGNDYKLVNERSNSMSYCIKRDRSKLYYKIYPYIKNNKADPTKSIQSHHIGIIRTIKDAKNLIDIFTKCYLLASNT